MSPAQPVNVVVDINVYLHAMSPGHRFQLSSEQALIRLIGDPRYRIETSDHILDNIYDKLQSQFGYPEQDAAALIIELEEILTTQTRVLDPDPDNLTDFISDREDDNILALAAESDAQLIVTNDFTDLVSMSRWRSIPILPAAKFNEYARTGVLPEKPEASATERIRRLISSTTESNPPPRTTHGPDLG